MSACVRCGLWAVGCGPPEKAICTALVAFEWLVCASLGRFVCNVYVQEHNDDDSGIIRNHTHTSSSNGTESSLNVCILSRPNEAGLPNAKLTRIDISEDETSWPKEKVKK
jgi:hypothetical protein